MVLITGATGFVGKALVDYLTNNRINVCLAVRESIRTSSALVSQVEVGDINPTLNWSHALKKVDTVIHLAARVHILNDEVDDPLAAFRRVNTDATLNLAKQAAYAGVKRFIFISSVKVNGEETLLNVPFTELDTFIPTDPYGLSKYEAEQGLLRIAKETGLEVVIIRPPLVYGPEVKANFAAMLQKVNLGIPLPLGAVNNKRSLIALDNLVSFISRCVEHPRAANEIFLISDGEDVSTTELLTKVSKAFGKKARLISAPVNLMTFVARMIGKGDMAKRLFGSLQVDNAKACDLLGWKPVVTMDQQLKKTVDAYLKNEKTY